MQAHRAHVGEQLEVLAQAQQALLRPNLRVGVVPLGSADRAEQHRIGVLARLHRLVGERGPFLVDGDATDEVVRENELVSATAGDFLEGAAGFADDLGTNAVTRQTNDGGFHGRAS